MRKNSWTSFTYSCILWSKSICECVHLKWLVISLFSVDVFLMIFTEKKRKIFKSELQLIQVFHWNSRKKNLSFCNNCQADPIWIFSSSQFLYLTLTMCAAWDFAQQFILLPDMWVELQQFRTASLISLKWSKSYVLIKHKKGLK